MTTNTDLANYALAHIGEPKISDIDDSGSHTARVCKQFAEPTIREVLRGHRWNCAIKRATLSALAEAPASNRYTVQYALPTDLLRLMEVNGEEWEYSQEYFEIENGKRLLSHRETAEIRYIAEIPVSEFDPLLAEAVATKLAGKIVIPLTAKTERQTQLLQLHRLAVAEARRVDAIEVGNKENRGFDRARQSSFLLRARYHHPLSRLNYLNYPWNV